MERELYRSRTKKILFGVCGGMADYMNLKPWTVRLIIIGMSLFCGGGIFVYIASIFMFPKEPIEAEVVENKEEEG